MSAAAGAGASAALTAGTAIGTTDAFFSAFFGFVHIPSGSAEDQHNHCNYNKIIHSTIATITATAIKPPRNPEPREPVVMSVPIW